MEHSISTCWATMALKQFRVTHAVAEAVNQLKSFFTKKKKCTSFNSCTHACIFWFPHLPWAKLDHSLLFGPFLRSAFLCIWSQLMFISHSILLLHKSNTSLHTNSYWIRDVAKTLAVHCDNSAVHAMPGWMSVFNAAFLSVKIRQNTAVETWITDC